MSTDSGVGAAGSADEGGDVASTRAGEYVLGTLDDHDHAQVQAAVERGETSIAVPVYQWQDRLLPLTLRVAPAAPSRALWPRVVQSIAVSSAQPARSDARSNSRVPSRSDARWWEDLGFWRGLSAAAVALSVGLGVALLYDRIGASADRAERYVAMLQSPDASSTAWMVEIRKPGVLRLVPVGPRGAIPSDRVVQFWTKAVDAAAPTSLGLVPVDRVTELPLARLPAIQAQQLFELTLEPVGGSPTGRPTGPILYVGRAVSL